MTGLAQHMHPGQRPIMLIYAASCGAGAVTGLFLAMAAIQFVVQDRMPASSYVTGESWGRTACMACKRRASGGAPFVPGLDEWLKACPPLPPPPLEYA
jgi:hypothetical protein